MEDLSPALILVWDVRRALERGRSVSFGIRQYLQRNGRDVFDRQLSVWWLAQSNPSVSFHKTQLGLHRRFLLELLEEGLRGHSIGQALQSLENELILSCEREIHEQIARLPLLSLFPLMGLIFPSLMLLLAVPLLRMLQF